MARKAKSDPDSGPRQSLDLVRDFLDSLPARTWIKDATGKYLYVNRKMLKDFGSTEKDWIGSTDEETAGRPESYRKNDLQVLSTGEPWRATELVQRGNRQEFAQLIKFPVVVGDETHLGGIAIDISEDVEALVKLHRLNQTMFRNERLRAIGEFAAGVAHDLNNALSAVTFRLGRVRAGERHEVSGQLDALERLVNDAAQRIRGLSDFARTHQQGEVEPIDVGAQIRRAIEMVEFVIVKRPTLFGATTPLEVKIPHGLPAVMGAPAEIAHVFANLMLNAREAMLHGGTIRVEATMAGSDAVAVTIADEGAGIPEKDLTKIFDPFFTTKPNGSGLGLSMARDVMGRIGGEIAAANRAAGGAIFTLTFPVYRQALKRA